MDTQALRETYDEINQCGCPYEKAILTGQCECSRASRFCLAEREGVRCTADQARTRCLALLDILRGQARFALKTLDQNRALAHNKALRVQVGGLQGLHKALWPERKLPTAIGDIDALIEQAIAEFGRLDALPFGQIVQQMAAYPGLRRRRSRSRSPYGPL
ncbi:hypothetical protein [Rhabdochromatium marinum]|uniref:hypothetical protein n=1 Tax=Rhabdochromatium marinum TaxID=48729 RepID=UPI001905AF62|nr:hypothetical protein [Rhabdochromatium marinum]MBK1647994.1 hypothetical protein [Rhabdochromatium marinum]